MKRYFKIIFTVFIMLLLFSVCASALSKMGSRSEEVRSIQQALKSRGYYTGNIDGIFGTATKNAVTAFQRDNGLEVDGIAGKETLKALNIADADLNSYGGYSSADYELLARIISAEARGEPYLGQVAVGAVVLNRIEHPSFPDTLSGVVYQRGAFSCLNDGQFYEPISDSAYKAASDAINGLDPSGGAIYYYNPAKSTNKWIFSRPVITTIGDHRFCS
ncbi:MAG: spore cortex-lytic enzyme [Acutalibacteraceae bacterium]|nr:spore cortex-lytic enzyme [Acutalibacteraceae bacterium]